MTLSSDCIHCSDTKSFFSNHREYWQMRMLIVLKFLKLQQIDTSGFKTSSYPPPITMEEFSHTSYQQQVLSLFHLLPITA